MRGGGMGGRGDVFVVRIGPLCVFCGLIYPWYLNKGKRSLVDTSQKDTKP